jgi:hypothetical protein
MGVSGSVVRGGVGVRAGEKWNDGTPVVMGPGASLQLMHTGSAREWTIGGPARLVACPRGDEELVLARGALRTQPGAGVRPGAEVWIGTPYGSLRYADARAELSVGSASLEVRVVSGSLWFASLGESAKERALSGGTQSFPAQAYRASPAQASARCGQSAELAAARAAALLGASAEPLGVRAAAHVRARQRARATCASALATLLDRDPLEGGAGSRLAELERFDELWRGVPDAPLAAQRP